jgi:hypothetical protein
MARVAARIASKLTLLLIAVSLLIAAGPFYVGRAWAAELSPRTIFMSSSMAADVNVSYRTSLTVATAGTIGSIKLEFCSNSPLEEDPCVAPVGFDASDAALGIQTGSVLGFALSPLSTANELILTRPPVAENAGEEAVFDITGIDNQTDPGSMFVRVLTYPTSDASGPATDSGGLALALNNNINIQAEVPPFIIFCVGESISGFDCTTATEAFSDLGIMTPSTTSAAQTQIVVATNAGDGYSMWMLGGTMTAGSNIIPAMAGGGPSVKGTSQFGLNLRANTNPVIGQEVTGPGLAGITPNYANQNQFRFNSGDVLASTLAPDDFRKYTVSYIVNVAAGQPGGVYSTTLTYVCLANF